MTEYIAILPDDVEPNTAYLRLPHPRTGAPQLYLPHPSGLNEVVRVGGAQGRTWFIGEETLAPGSMLLHVPIDLLFLAIPVALSLLPADTSRPAPFQPLSDLLATAASSPAFALKPAFSPTADPEKWNPDLARLAGMKSFRRAFRACCERKLVPSADDGAKPIPYYRPSRARILAQLQAKVDRLASPEHFGKFDHLIRSLGRDGLLGREIEQSLVQAARSRASIDHIAQFVPSALLPSLISAYDFAALDEHSRSRAAAALAAAAPIVNEKKGKGAGTKRKAAGANASRGVEALKKVNTRGMAKLSSFFKPKDGKE